MWPACRPGRSTRRRSRRPGPSSRGAGAATAAWATAPGRIAGPPCRSPPLCFAGPPLRAGEAGCSGVSMQGLFSHIGEAGCSAVYLYLQLLLVGEAGCSGACMRAREYSSWVRPAVVVQWRVHASPGEHKQHGQATSAVECVTCADRLRAPSRMPTHGCTWGAQPHRCPSQASALPSSHAFAHTLLCFVKARTRRHTPRDHI